MTENKMRVVLVSHTPAPETVVAAAAKLCYSQSAADDIMDGLTPEKAEGFVKMLGDLGHESPFEHTSFTFCIDGVSRALLAQITRHRIASFSVQSQRYVNMDGCFEFVTPPAIAKNKQAAALFEQSMKENLEHYLQLIDILKPNIKKRFLEQGKDEKAAESAAEKEAIEDARFVLPNACVTKILLTMNARSLTNFFALRCCRRAQWEIRALATEMLRLVRSAAPALFLKAGPGCVSGPCPEGRMSCGMAKEVKQEFCSI